MTEAPTQEQNQRLNILNTLLTTPHRELQNVFKIHQEMIDQDPLFYVRLASWYDKTGEIRDHKEMFIIQLCLSDFPGHREVGLSMLRELPPYQVVRIVDFIGGKRIKQYRESQKGVGAKRRKIRQVVKGEDGKPALVSYGLGKNIPRSLKTEITRYLRDRENDNAWFDSSALIARKYLKRLYAKLRVEPSERAQAILFDDQPPEDSSLAAVKELRNASDATEQARVVIEKKIPYRVASTIVSAMTPTVMLALISVMSDQELINNLGSLKKRGVFDNDELRELVTSRLEKAKKGKRVAAVKASDAAKASGVDEQMAKVLDGITDAQLKSKGRIKRSTALLIDKSGSMSEAIEIGKRIGAMVGSIMDAPLYVYAFDEIALPIKTPESSDFAAWEKAFQGIRPGSCTSCGSGIVALHRNKQPVEQIIMVTDEGENSSPPFLTSLLKYKEDMNVDPHVIFVKTRNSSNKLEGFCSRNAVSHDAWQFDGDYYSLPNLIPFLTQGSRLEVLFEIMETDLPERKVA